jgi:hypothetical protein
MARLTEGENHRRGVMTHSYDRVPQVISNEQRDAMLAASPSPDRVTPGYIQSRIRETTFSRLDATVTLCSIRLDNGFSVRGESACVDPANYNREIGEKIAYDNAFQKLWPLFGFLLAEKRFLTPGTVNSDSNGE